MGNALVDNLLAQEEVKLKELCKPIVKLAKKQSSLFKNRRINVGDFFEYNSEEESHKFYLGYLLRFGFSRGLFTKSISYQLLCHIEVLVYGTYSIDPDLDSPVLEPSKIEIIIEGSFNDAAGGGWNFYTPLGTAWHYVYSPFKFLMGDAYAEINDRVSLAEHQTKKDFIRPLLTKLDNLREELSNNFNISVSKIKVISKD